MLCITAAAAAEQHKLREEFMERRALGRTFSGKREGGFLVLYHGLADKLCSYGKQLKVPTILITGDLTALSIAYFSTHSTTVPLHPAATV
jgi:hypothetical protein